MMLVINLNSNICRIYQYKRHTTELSLEKEINHPENRIKTSDQVSGSLGRFKSNKSSQNAYAPHTEMKEVHIDRFAKEVADELNKLRIKNGLDSFFIIATPHMLGLLNQHMDKHIQEKIFKIVQKDLVAMPKHELAAFLKEHSAFQGEE